MAEASADFDKLLKKSENTDPNIARFSPRGMSTMDNLRTSKSMTNGKEPREGTARLWGAGPPAAGPAEAGAARYCPAPFCRDTQGGRQRRCGLTPCRQSRVCLCLRLKKKVQKAKNRVIKNRKSLRIKDIKQIFSYSCTMCCFNQSVITKKSICFKKLKHLECMKLQ